MLYQLGIFVKSLHRIQEITGEEYEFPALSSVNDMLAWVKKWKDGMGETISFAPRKAIKSQVLADFVAEWVDTQLPTAPIQPELWTCTSMGH